MFTVAVFDMGVMGSRPGRKTIYHNLFNQFNPSEPSYTVKIHAPFNYKLKSPLFCDLHCTSQGIHVLLFTLMQYTCTNTHSSKDPPVHTVFSTDRAESRSTAENKIITRS